MISLAESDFLDRLGPGVDIDLRKGLFELDEVLERCERTLGTVRFDGRSWPTADFRGVRFTGDVHFDGATFDEAVFVDARFEKSVFFTDAVFRGDADFGGAVVRGRAEFVRATFETLTNLGPMKAEEFNLDDATFTRPVELEVTPGTLRCVGTRFEQGVTMRIPHGSVIAERTVFGAPSSIAGTSQLVLDDGTLLGRSHEPRLLSLRGTDVSNLAIVEANLVRCRFSGAHRLDQLRLEGFCAFGRPPRWRTRRQVIAEEAVWRNWRDLPYRTTPEQLAGLYRSLRKSFEDSKNEAGAGDFYYGEMEMRRRSTETGRAERFVLWCYWVLSGYGQRAIRAVVALLVLVATVAVLLAVWGQPAAEAAQIAVGVVVLRDPGAKLTEAGQWTVMVARFLGPVLLALAVLAVRARVKR